MSNLDMALGDMIKMNKKAGGGRGGRAAGGAQKGGIAKSASRQGRQAGRQAGTLNKKAPAKKGQGKLNAPSQKKPRQQAKQTPVAEMRAAGRQSRQNVTANRQTNSRSAKLNSRRGLGAVAAPIAASQPVLVYTDANGQQIRQPVAVVQQPGQNAQVIPTGAPTRTGPMFKSANRQQNNAPQQKRRTSGGGNQQQQQGGSRRQSGRGARN